MTVTRTTTFVDNAILTASQLNNEFNNLLNAPAIVNADISSSAAIAYSKLNLSSSIVNADISNSASIATSKINTTFPSGVIVGTTDSQTLTNKIFSSPTIQGYDGWIGETATLTYASATSVTTSGSIANYPVGTRVKFTNNSVTFYGVVSSTSGSTINLAPTSDYSVNNSAITNPFYSYDINPQGYPDWFNYSETWSGFSANPTGGIIRYKVTGRQVTYVFERSTGGTSNATSVTISLPITATSNANYQLHQPCQVEDSGTFSASPGLLQIAGASQTTATVFQNMGGGGWTNSGTKLARGTIIYEI